MSRDVAIRGMVPLTIIALLVGSVLAAASSVVSLGSRADRAASDRFWSHLYLNAVSANYESVVDMMKSSDVVVVGRLGPLQESRSWVAAPELGDDGLAFYARSTVQIERVVYGDYVSSSAENLALELFVPVPKEFESFKSTVPAERTLLFLGRKADTKEPLYGIVSPNRGYIRDFGQAEPPVGADDDWLLSVRAKSFDKLVRELLAASGQL